MNFVKDAVHRDSQVLIIFYERSRCLFYKEPQKVSRKIVKNAKPSCDTFSVLSG